MYPNLTHAFFDPPESTTQMASPSVQPFCPADGRVSSGMPGHVLSPKIALLHRGIRSPFNTWFLEPTIAHNRNIISIGSAVFCTAHGRWHARECPFPLKLPLRMGICIPCNTCFVYHEIQPNIFQSINIFYRILLPGYVSKV